MRTRPDHLRLVSSREPEPEPTKDQDLTEIAAGLADVVIEQANRIARAATLDDVTTVVLWLLGDCTDKPAALQDLIRRCWSMVEDRQEDSRRLAAGRPASSRKAVPIRRDPIDDGRQLDFQFGGAA